MLIIPLFCYCAARPIFWNSCLVTNWARKGLVHRSKRDKKNWHRWSVVYWLGIIRLLSSSYYWSPTICSVFGWKCWQAYFISFLIDSYPSFLTIYIQLLCGTSFILVAHCISNKPKIAFEWIWLFRIFYVHYLDECCLIHF